MIYSAILNLVRICSPLSLFIKILEVAHTHELSGHRAESTTYRVQRYFYWSGMFKWIEMLMLDCLSCQTNTSARRTKRSNLRTMGKIRSYTPEYTSY